MDCQTPEPAPKKRGRPPGRRGPARSITAKDIPDLPVAISPDDVRRLRAQIFASVQRMLPVAEEVVMGRVKWNAQQTQVFKALMAKAMPDLEAKMVQHNITSDVNDLSVSDLVRIAREGM